MDMHRRDFLKSLTVLAAAGIAPAAAAAGREAFTVYGAPALPSMTIAVAALQGRLAKQADVSLKIWRSPDQLRAGVAGGQYKVMMSPSNVGANLRNQGRKIGMVNILTNGIIQLVGKTSLPRPQDLAGKKILIPFKNDMPDIVFQALMKKLNIDTGKIGISYAATPAEAVARYRAWLDNTRRGQCVRDLLVNHLWGRDLACWCPPGQPCHADVLLELANPRGTGELENPYYRMWDKGDDE